MHDILNHWRILGAGVHWLVSLTGFGKKEKGSNNPQAGKIFMYYGMFSYNPTHLRLLV